MIEKNMLSLPERSNAQYLPKMGPYPTRKLSFNHYMFVHASLNFHFRNMSIFNVYGRIGQHFNCYLLASWESGFIDWLISYAIPDRIILFANETIIIFTHKWTIMDVFPIPPPRPEIVSMFLIKTKTNMSVSRHT